MKKPIAILLTLALLIALPALAENALETAARSVQDASTLDAQLVLLYDISLEHAGALEVGGWNCSLTCDPAQPLPRDVLPEGDMEEAALSLSDFEGAKFIAIYDDQGAVRLLGDFQVRLPEAMRAASLEEADAVLCLAHSTQARDDYIGAAYDRLYNAYVYRRGANERATVYQTRTTPPVSGYGTLTGETVPLCDLWSGVRQWFYGVVEITYPEGVATYRVTGQSCCLAGLEGAFTRYEIPAEVEGHPVAGIEWCVNDTLEELALPEGIVWIRRVGGEKLHRMNFPSTLRRIEDSVPVFLDEMILNEGLEEIADFAVLSGRGERFALPSTLTSLGRGSLEYGIDCPYLVIPDGVTHLPDYFLSSKGRGLCAFVPASVTSFGSDLFNYGNVLIYTPEGSPAAQWATGEGYEWAPCASAEEMPRPAYATENGFEYAVVEGEAVLTGYSGGEACVRVPDELGGCPVAIVREHAFYNNDALRAVLFPDTVRKMEGSAVYECESLEAAFIPSTPTDFHSQAVLSCGENAVIYTPEGGVPWEKLTNYYSYYALEAWTPDADAAWFPAD